MNRIYSYTTTESGLRLVESFWCDKCLQDTLKEEPLTDNEQLERNCKTDKPCCAAGCPQDKKQ